MTWLVGGYFVVVNPVTNKLRDADAVVVLGSPVIDGRLQLGRDLVERDYATTLVISMQSANQWRARRACEGALSPMHVLCFQPHPGTTQGEARQIRAYARKFGWKRIIVVTSSYHISRARMIISRCFDGTVLMESPKTHHSPLKIAYQYLYQTAGYVKAFLVTRGC